MARARRSGLVCAALAGPIFVSGTAFAGPEDPTQPPARLPAGRDEDGRPPAASTTPEWHRMYEGAREKLLAGDFASAAVLFAELERVATNDVDRAVAHAQRTLADDWTVRGLAFRQGSELGAPHPPSRERSVKLSDTRSTDEIVSLYLTSGVYGVASGIWVATLTQPDSVVPTVLPMLVLTAGATGTVMALDRGRGFRHGVPQSIVTGAFIGLEEGLAWTLFHNEAANTPDLGTNVHTSIVWAASTVGAVGGGILGSVIPTTPGRSAWVGSTTLWTGTLAMLVSSIAARSRTSLAAGGAGLSVGLPLGILTAGVVSPSISRVRLLDVSGVVGGLLGAGVYAGAFKQDSTTGYSAAASLGVGVGLLAAFFATSSMGKDVLRTTGDTTEEDSKSWLARIHPFMSPSSDGGAMMGAGGSLD